MLQISLLHENKQAVIDALKIKNFDATEIVERSITLDNKRKELKGTLDNILAESNKMAKEIGMLFKSGKPQEANQLKEKTSELKAQSKKIEEELNEVMETLDKTLVELPNIPPFCSGRKERPGQ